MDDRMAGTRAPARTSGSTMPPRQKAGGPVATSDLVRIIAELTEDIERFDSMISSQRRLLEERRSPLGTANDVQLREESDRISTSAAAFVARARGALAELRTLSEGPDRG